MADTTLTGTGKRPVGRTPHAAVGWVNGKWVLAHEPEPSNNLFIEDAYDFNTDHPAGIFASHDSVCDKLRQVKDQVKDLKIELAHECAPAPSAPMHCIACLQ